MKLNFVSGEHHNAAEPWKEQDQFEWLTDVFAMPSIAIEPRCTRAIRSHVEDELTKEGWAINVPLASDSSIYTMAKKGDLAFQLQTGNWARVPYDFLKFEYFYKTKQIEAAAYAVPTLEAAKLMGSNIANADRVTRELKLFDRVITCPILVIAFD